MPTATETETTPPRYELPHRMEDRRRLKLLTGHWACPVPLVLGWWMIEAAPDTEEYLFSHDPAAREIIDRHNALYRAKHGDAVADEFQAAHDRWCARVAAAQSTAADHDA